MNRTEFIGCIGLVTAELLANRFSLATWVPQGTAGRRGWLRPYEKSAMATYFFDVQDGSFIPDLNGVDLPDLDSARDEALRQAIMMLATSKRDFWRGHAWKMIVSDKDRHIQFSLNFMAVNAPLTETYGRRPSDD